MYNSNQRNAWQDNVAISVIVLTYNHGEYIDQCMDGILTQEVSVPYEIIVYDDFSQDNTRDYLAKVYERYPDCIRLLLSDVNQFSKEIDYFSDIVRNIAKGKYIALCEGDDYWCSTDKLQRQFDALEAHLECDMCACRANMISEDGKHILGEIRPREGDGILPIEKVIMGGGNYVASAGLFFRKSMFDHMLSFEKVRSLDYSHQIKGALRGGICYIDRPMAAYRRYSKSSVTVQIIENDASMRHQCEQEKEILRTLDEETDGKYHEVITRRIEDYSISYYDQLVERKDEIIKLLEKENADIYIWGMGPRGRNLEHFLQDEKIKICGVCDITDQKVGQKTDIGNSICYCDAVLKNADLILASVNGAYDYLKKQDLHAAVINMHEFMPRS